MNIPGEAITGAFAIATTLIAARANSHAKKASKNSLPVANGFTKHVIDELTAIRGLIFTHVGDHHHTAKPETNTADQ